MVGGQGGGGLEKIEKSKSPEWGWPGVENVATSLETLFMLYHIKIKQISILMFLLGSGGFGRVSRGWGGGALEITATACSEPPVRSKSLL